MALETTAWIDATAPTSNGVYDSATGLYDSATETYDGVISNDNSTVWTAID